MAWFRFYDEVADDPKVQRLPPILFRAWVNFMCLAKRNGGVLPEVEDLAYGLRVTVSRAQYFHDELRKADLVDMREDGSFEMHNWHDRQFQSDVSTGRVKRFRERQRNVSETVNETDQNRAEQNRTDTEQIRTEETPKPPLLIFGEHGWVRLTHEQHEKLKAKLNSHLESYITDFDDWVQQAPDAKHAGVKRRDRDPYSSINSWFNRDVKEGKLNDRGTNNQKLREEVARRLAAES